MKNRIFVRLTGQVLLSAIATLSMTPFNTSQAAGADKSQVADTGLVEIIVTARKRSESILKVPVTETVLSANDLLKYGTSDLKNLSAQVPNLVISGTNAILGTQATMRGIGTYSLNPATDQAVSLSLDGLQVTNGTGYGSGMFDLAQAEVLAGPQALFFGKSSTGGVISLRSADPTDKTEIIGRIGYEIDAREKSAEAIASGAVSSTLKLRLAMKYTDSDGFFYNKATAIPGLGGVTPTHDRGPQSKNYLTRLTALWSPSENFDARLKLNYAYTKDDNTNGNVKLTNCPNGTAPFAFPVPFISPNLTCTANRDLYYLNLDPALYVGIPNGGVQYDDSRNAYGTIELNYRPAEDITVTSLTGYYYLHQSSLIDPTGASAAGPAVVIYGGPERREISQEVRVNSDYSGPVNFTVGAYFQNSRLTQTNHVALSQAFPFFPPFLQDYYMKLRDQTSSVFAQLRYRVVPDVEIAAGARYQHETRKMDQFVLVAPGVVYPNYTNVPLGDPRISSSPLNPEVSITYTPSDDLTVYGSYKKGSKSGSYNVAGTTSAGGLLSYGDESARGFEVGLKGRLEDRHLSYNLAAYRYTYAGLQVGANQFVDGVSILKTLNAGSAKSYGVDLNASYRVQNVEGLQLNGSANWNKARYKKFNNAQCYGGQTIAAGCNLDLVTATGLYSSQDLSGQPLVRAPEWTGNIGVDYSTMISANLKMSVAANTSLSSSFFTNATERPDMTQKAYSRTSLSASVGGENDSWNVALIGNNIFNKITASSCFNGPFADGVFFAGQTTGGTVSGPSGVDSMECTLDAGRSVMLRLTVKL